MSFLLLTNFFLRFNLASHIKGSESYDIQGSTINTILGLC